MIVIKNKPGQQKILAAWFSWPDTAQVALDCWQLLHLPLPRLQLDLQSVILNQTTHQIMKRHQLKYKNMQSATLMEFTGILNIYFFQFFHFHVTGKAK
jgi:hypothetical protein